MILRYFTLECVLRIIDDANAAVANNRFAVYRIANFERQLVARELGFVDAAREVKRRKDLVDAVVAGVQHQDDALDVVAVLFQKSPDSSCEAREKRIQFIELPVVSGMQ